MPAWGENGGWNRCCGQIEKAPRIDSFELARSGAWSAIACGVQRVDAYHDWEWCRLFPAGSPIGGIKIALSSKRNGYGGRQLFFLCPACGQRVRFLYQSGRGFCCRMCARLNYRSQQETRSGSLYYYNRGMAYADRHPDQWQQHRPAPSSFSQWTPPPPRYMHETTHRRFLDRLRRYQEKHEARQLKKQLELLRRLVILTIGAAAWDELLRTLESEGDT